MHEFLFDMKLRASIHVKAKDKAEAERILEEVLDCADCNFGSWEGDAIRGEASLDGKLDLVEIDGEAV